jgi:hypothetical protein
MHYLRQDNLLFVGSSHEFVGAEQGETSVSVFLFHGKPGSGPVRTGILMTRYSSSVKAAYQNVEPRHHGRGHVTDRTWCSRSPDSYWASRAVRVVAVLVLAPLFIDVCRRFTNG